MAFCPIDSVKCINIYVNIPWVYYYVPVNSMYSIPHYNKPALCPIGTGVYCKEAVLYIEKYRYNDFWPLYERFVRERHCCEVSIHVNVAPRIACV